VVVSFDEGVFVVVEFSVRDGVPRAGDETHVEMQIVEGKQPQSEHFTGAKQVANVGSGESGDMRVG
jgi:hypothetical protein